MLSPQVALSKSSQAPRSLLHRHQAIQWPSSSLKLIELKVNLRFWKGISVCIYIYIYDENSCFTILLHIMNDEYMMQKP